MRDFKGIAKIVKDIECLPFRLEFGCVGCLMDHAECSEWCYHNEYSWYVEATLYRPDTHTNKFEIGYGGKYFLSPLMSDDAIIKKCFVACRDYSEHEVREAFRYKGRRVLSPHISIQSLWEAAEDA